MQYEEEDTCMSYEEEDTCMSYEEEDTCLRVNVGRKLQGARALQWLVEFVRIKLQPLIAVCDYMFVCIYMLSSRGSNFSTTMLCVYMHIYTHTAFEFVRINLEPLIAVCVYMHIYTHVAVCVYL